MIAMEVQKRKNVKAGIWYLFIMAVGLRWNFIDMHKYRSDILLNLATHKYFKPP